MRRVVYSFVGLCVLILTVIALCTAVNNEISLMQIITIAIALLVEVMNRYAMIYYPILISLASMQLGLLRNKIAPLDRVNRKE